MRIVIMMTLLLVTSRAFAADDDISKQPTKSPQAAEAPKSTSQEVVKDKKPPEWPRPYKPTEEISADSTVPFPTDI